MKSIHYLPVYSLAALCLASLLVSLDVVALPDTSIPYSYHQGTIPQLPPGVSVMAGYITIKNNSNKALVLLKFSSKHFSRVEVHKTINKGGILSMQRQMTLTVAAHSNLTLKPGGLHFMLIGPNRPLPLNQSVNILCETSNHKRLRLTLIVKPLIPGTSHKHHR